MTSSTGTYNTSPSLSGDGARVAFTSNDDHTGENVDGNYEVFVHDTTTGISQITSTVGSSTTAPTISADGERVVFASTGNLSGENPSGTQQVFLDDETFGTVQLTDASGGQTGDPDVSGDGSTV